VLQRLGQEAAYVAAAARRGVGADGVHPRDLRRPPVEEQRDLDDADVRHRLTALEARERRGDGVPVCAGASRDLDALVHPRPHRVEEAMDAGARVAIVEEAHRCGQHRTGRGISATRGGLEAMYGVRRSRMTEPMELRFDRGTLLLVRPPSRELAESLPGMAWDARVGAYRAPPWRYREIVDALASRRVAARVRATAFARVEPWPELELRPYQRAAVAAWEQAGRRGVIALPTGSGKTRVALAAMRSAGCASLCLVPTRVLLHQWRQELGRGYPGQIGVWGDGARALAPITVMTFESAYRNMAALGCRFALLVVDEAHHFGGNARDEALEMSLAPYRLGLSATPPDEPAALAQLTRLLGPVVFERSVADLAGSYLADFDLVPLHIGLDREEEERYAELMGAFRPVFAAFRQIAPGAKWSDFVAVARQTQEGRAAIAAWRQAQRLVAFTRGKAAALDALLAEHRQAKVLVFTADNETAYAIARRHLIMPITCDIGRAEREAALARFARGELHALVSARVLNEGLDVPDADVGIIVGATLGEREHIQRVGRLLRPGEGKRALVYELIAAGTSETARAARRRSRLTATVPALHKPPLRSTA
jgi:superfamily II DNA or RNA helicase